MTKIIPKFVLVNILQIINYFNEHQHFSNRILV
jgi:hypothetical protein